MKEVRMDRDTLRAKLGRIQMFQTLAPDEMLRFLPICKVLQFEPGETIITENEISPYLYAILDGTVHVLVAGPHGKNVFMSSIGDGVIGEAAIFSNMKRTANVVSTDSAQLVQIERKQFIVFLRENANAGLKLLMYIVYSLIRKLREANQELAFERKAFLDQSEIDDLFSQLGGKKA